MAVELKISPQLERRDALLAQMYAQYLATFEEEEASKQAAVTQADVALRRTAHARPPTPPQLSSAAVAGGAAGGAASSGPAAAAPVPVTTVVDTVGGGADGAPPPVKVAQPAVLDQRCEICSTANDPASMLLCDACDGGYHTYCLTPKVTEVPKGNWRCWPRAVPSAQSRGASSHGDGIVSISAPSRSDFSEVIA